MIRMVKKEDAKDIHYINKKTAEETEFLSRVVGEYQQTIEDVEWELSYILKSSNCFFLVLELEGKVVGLCQLHNPSPRYKCRHKLELGIKILAEYCNQGYGRKLMEAAIQLAIENGYDMITLTCMKENTRAIHLYESLGFIQYGQLDKSYKKEDSSYQDEIFMVKYIENI